MNEQAILRQIAAYLDESESEKQLRVIHQMQDHLHALQDGETQATSGWVNSNSLLFPEDFADAMRQLHADLTPINGLLAQLTRIEEALEKQKDKLNRKCDVCGAPATNEAYDRVKVPTGGPVVNRVSTGKVHRGCDKHPASQRVRRS